MGQDRRANRLVPKRRRDDDLRRSPWLPCEVRESRRPRGHPATGRTRSSRRSRTTCPHADPGREVSRRQTEGARPMSWTKTSDDIPDRLWSLSDAAFRLHSHATVWSNRLLTDGEIPTDRLRVLVPRFRASAVVELESAGLWSKTETGYRIDGFLVDQPSQREVKARREYDVIRQQKSAAPTTEAKAALTGEEEAAKRRLWEARESRRASSHSVRTTVIDSVIHDAPSQPVPTRPNPSPLTSFGAPIPAAPVPTASTASQPGSMHAPFGDEIELRRRRGGGLQPVGDTNERSEFRDKVPFPIDRSVTP